MSNIIFTLVSRGFGWNLMREIFTSLDGAIFSLFSAIIQLMFDIVRVTASDTFFNDIQSRIYVVLSIYMLFKVTISLITYVVNPDSMSDKSQGVGKLVQRIMISMVMLIAFPMVFEKLTQYQSDIIESGTIDNIILGSNSVNDQQNAGDGIGVAVYDGFIIRLKDTSIADGAATGITKVSDATDIVNLPGDTNDVYKYEYIPLIGFALGVLMTLLILSFCIDLAIRVFKLIILQLIAPIPIISYIDPKASKDGAFSKWIKMVGTTWASLFVRLVVIDFILLLIKEIIGGSEAALNIESGGIMVKVALIIGLLFFAKNLPKFIGDALGIKIEGGLFAGLGQIAAAGAIGLGAVGAGVGIAKHGFQVDKGSGKLNPLTAMKNVGAGLFGAAGGLATGAMAAAKAKDHSSKAVMEARNKYLANQLAGNTAMHRVKMGMSSLLLGGADSSAMDAQVAAYDNAFNKAKALKSAAESKMAESTSIFREIDGHGRMNWKEFAMHIDGAKNDNKDSIDYLASHNFANWQEAQMQMDDIKDVFTGAFLADVKNGKESNGVVFGAIEEAEAAMIAVNETLDVSSADTALKNLKTAMGHGSDGARAIKLSDDYIKSHGGGKK